MFKCVGDVARIRTGRTPAWPWRRELYSDTNGIPFVRVGDITKSNGMLLTTEKNLLSCSFESVEANPESVLMSKSGTIGAVTILKINACFNQAILALDELDGLIPKYLMFQLMAKKIEFEHLAYGTCQENLRRSVFAKTKIQVPSIDEQVDTLKKLESIEEMIRLTDKKLCNMRRMQTLILQQTFKK